MKYQKQSIIGAVFLITLLWSAMASAEWNLRMPESYLGLGVGMSELEPNTGGNRISDSKDIGFKIFAGYALTPRIKLEGYYADLGEAESVAPNGSIGYKTFGLSGLFYLYKEHDEHVGWGVYGRGGVGRMNNDSTLNFTRNKDFHLMYGGGIEYGFENGFAFRGDVDIFDEDAHLFGLYLLKRFGGGERKATPVRESDQDGDGVSDTLDHCMNTDRGLAVDSKGCELDLDRDGVMNKDDLCPNTPIGAAVDARGCQADDDGDGVVDSTDVCPNTPAGVAVDWKGCERDDDGDGVVNSQDACPNTPVGIAVDTQGCLRDDDGDHVDNLVDACPNTPPGIAVDAKGCPLDRDGDGIGDAVDACPNTPMNASVDRRGCERDDDGDRIANSKDRCPQTPKGENVDAKGCKLEDIIVLEGVTFATNSAELISHSEQALNELRDTLKRHPDLKIEVAGHTDKRGTRKYNLSLSKRRAEEVRKYLIEQGISEERIIAKGYGPDKPITNDDSIKGLAKNRRVEIHLLD